MPKAVALIVPCFNEAERLDAAEFLALSRRRPDLSLVFVDDGSDDRTGALLESMRRASPEHVEVVSLEQNRGKAEAVREGLRAALAGGARVVGYLDADLSTPASEMLRLVAELEAGGAEVVLGSRVRLLGTDIARRAHRHYLGRLFGTLASLALGLPVYDTQCGAKLFRASPALVAALEAPFRSRWIFDVELLARLLRPPGGVAPLSAADLREVPLRVWRDVAGSKLRLASMLRAGLQLIGLLARSRLLPAPRSARSVAAPAREDAEPSRRRGEGR